MIKGFKRLITIALCSAIGAGLGGCSGGASDSIASGQGAAGEAVILPQDKDGWVATWVGATLNSSEDILPKSPTLEQSTCRMQFKASLGGEKVRLSFSNEYGEELLPPGSDMELKSVHIARLVKPGSPEIVPESDTKVTFSGSESITIPSGEIVTSDEIDFVIEDLEYIAVTVSFGSVPEFPACHREADCASWVAQGEKQGESFTPEAWMWSYFSFFRADVWAKAGECSLVCFGDSITDGSVSTFNGFDAWPDLLAESLILDGRRISVVNSAIAGNAVTGGWGVAARDRFERDVIRVPGVRYAVILIGTNDIPGAQTDISQQLIDEYRAMIDACHSHGIKVLAGTITPFMSNEWWASELHEGIRTSVNDWIMSGDSGFDGYIDFSSALSDPERPDCLFPEYDSGDGLHPSVAGHRRMGEAAIEAVGEFLNGL